jgi:hypothetical protein
MRILKNQPTGTEHLLAAKQSGGAGTPTPLLKQPIPIFFI